MSSTIQHLIKYFHDCYRSDNRGHTILDFFDKSIENRIYIEGKEELLTGDYPVIPIEAKKGEALFKKSQLFQKEKELIYAAFFVCGTFTEDSGKLKQLCAPLFYYPAKIEEDDGYFFASLNTNERRINHALIKLLESSDEPSMIEDKLFIDMPQDHISFEQISVLSKLLNAYYPSIDTEDIGLYPNNLTQKNFKKKLTELKNNEVGSYAIFSASMVGLITRSENTRGVLNELKELGTNEEYSTPLQYLFNQTDTNLHPSIAYEKGNLPIVLSEAQQAILKSGSINPVTLIIGPPGTGKTYTIGALAIEHMIRGESVLIASRTDEAVDVIGNKIHEQLNIDRCVVRGGRKRKYITPLRRYIKSLMTRVNKLDYLFTEFDLQDQMKTLKFAKNFSEIGLKGMVYQLTNAIKKINTQLNNIEKDFLKEIENELNWGDFLSKKKENVWHLLKEKFLAFKNRFQKPIWEYANKLETLEDDRHQKLLKLIRLTYILRVFQLAMNQWHSLKTFYEALNTHNDTEKIQKLESIEFNAIFKAFPIWLVKISEVKNMVPFKKEMFDVLIIDEATQCDIASCLPLIQRAKRVVFAGDPNQLRHISFLSRGLQDIYKAKYDLQQFDSEVLNYRDKSILDLVSYKLTSHEQVAMLDEHYRSKEPIIRFSNQTFYENALRIMTNRPEGNEHCLVIRECGGVRDRAGYNKKEADAILNRIKKTVEEEKTIAKGFCTDIGVLSPFRAQVDYLSKQLLESFSIEQLEKHKIRVGTAFGFQGEERDMMLISFVVDANSHHSAMIHINKEDVFNVSITRSRNKQYIFTSIDSKELKGSSLLRKYLESIHNSVKSAEKGINKHDEFLADVLQSLDELSLKDRWMRFHTAGLNLDILLKYKGKYVGIDLIGYPGEFKDMFGLERYRILKRAGIDIFPFPYSNWYFEKEQTLKAFFDFIEGKSYD